MKRRAAARATSRARGLDQALHGARSSLVGCSALLEQIEESLVPQPALQRQAALVRRAVDGVAADLRRARLLLQPARAERAPLDVARLLCEVAPVLASQLRRPIRAAPVRCALPMRAAREPLAALLLELVRDLSARAAPDAPIDLGARAGRRGVVIRLSSVRALDGRDGRDDLGRALASELAAELGARVRRRAGARSIVTELRILG